MRKLGMGLLAMAVLAVVALYGVDGVRGFKINNPAAAPVDRVPGIWWYYQGFALPGPHVCFNVDASNDQLYRDQYAGAIYAWNNSLIAAGANVRIYDEGDCHKGDAQANTNACGPDVVIKDGVSVIAFAALHHADLSG